MKARTATYECDQSRRPHWAHHNRSRNPEPSSTYKCPTSVVKRSKSPRFLFHPGPAPGPNIDPVTEAVRSPSHGDGARAPARTVSGYITPVAVLVEVFIAGYFARNIICGIGVVFAIVTVEGPAVEIIAIGNLAEIVVDVLLVAGKSCGLACDHGIGKSAARNSTAAVPDVGDGATSVLAYVDTIFTGLQQGQRDVWGIDFVRISIIEMPHAQNHGTLRQTDLGGMVVERQEGDSGLRTQADRRGTNVHFGARIFVRPEIVTRNHRTIRHACDPVIFAGWAKRDRPL